MSETRGLTETSDSAGQAAMNPTNSRTVVTKGGSASPSPLSHRIEDSIERETARHGSFSEERFFALREGSWESHSFDSDEPTFGGRLSCASSRTSLRDRRKRFDSTTPTLIDEEDEMEGSMSTDSRNTHHLVSEDDSSLRRTPGAPMYKSTFDSSQDGAGEETTASVERRKNNDASLGFGLTLTTPVASSAERQQMRKLNNVAPLWQDLGDNNESEQMPTLTALASPLGGSSRTPFIRIAADSKRKSETKGQLSYTEWTSSSSHVSDAIADDIRNAAVSPTILRLREDLGTLLQEDEDDDYTLELSNMFRGGIRASAASGEDWTGSYVFSAGEQLSKPGVPRNYAVQTETRGRRRPVGVQKSNLALRQQPTPRKNVNEGFEFGNLHGDEMASPQQIHFGGAFAPLSNSANCTKPVPSSVPVGVHYGPSPSFAPTFTMNSAFQFGAYQHFQGPSVEAQHGHGYGAAQSSRCYSPNPVYYITPTSPPQSQQGLEMQATAREFVPTSSPIGILQSSFQSWSPPTHPHFDPTLDQSNWTTAATFRFSPHYTHGYPPLQIHSDSRVTMTPSPYHCGWHSAMSSGPSEHYFRATMTPTPTFSQSSAISPVSQQRDPHHKIKDAKREKRGKKKTPPQTPREKSDTISFGRKTSTHKKGKDESRTSNQDGDKSFVSTPEDLTDSRRVEPVESPATRTALKEFFRSFRNVERSSFQKAEEFARQAIQSMAVPENVHWRVFLELADLAKRSNRFAEARRLYQHVCQLQPYAFQGWIEFSKLEEECGNLNRVMNVLHAGLEYCENNEALMTRALRLQEKTGNLDTARVLLARLKHVEIHKVWRTVLEGALMEARAGNVTIARHVLKYLMYHVPWYGPLYLEAYCLERDQGQVQEALKVVEKGLLAIPRYSPLWFGALRLCEEIDYACNEFDLPTACDMVERAIESISKELIWKVHLEAAQMLERALLKLLIDDQGRTGMLYTVRQRLSLAILTCPGNLRWRVWLAAARSELVLGQSDRARKLFLRAHRVVPDKGRSSTLLDCARMEEFLGETALARAILCKGRREYAQDWKVWLESVLLEVRDTQFLRAIEICTSALGLHSGAGRLWASLIQLGQFHGGDAEQSQALTQALYAVPKSGEVWCEGARIHLNPFSTTFDVDRARRHLYFATKFTPQYGDIFVEGIKLEVLQQWLVNVADTIWEETKIDLERARAVESENVAISKYVGAVILSVAPAFANEKGESGKYGVSLSSLRERMSPEAVKNSINLSDLRQACSNADPNYGSLWFYCRKGASEPTRKTIDRAAEIVTKEMCDYSYIFLAAILRRRAVLALADLKRPTVQGIESTDPTVAEWEDEADSALSAATSLDDIIKSLVSTRAEPHFHEAVNGSLFVTGLTELNRHSPVPAMGLAERARVLFGNDSLFP